MTRYGLGLLMMMVLTTTSAWNKPPCLELTNSTRSPLIIEADPNWDDQMLIVNGQRVSSFHSELLPQAAIYICGIWSEFGLDFYSHGHFVFVEVSNLNLLPYTRLTTIPSHSLRYHVLSQDAELLAIELLDVVAAKTSS